MHLLVLMHVLASMHILALIHSTVGACVVFFSYCFPPPPHPTLPFPLLTPSPSPPLLFPLPDLLTKKKSRQQVSSAVG